MLFFKKKEQYKRTETVYLMSEADKKGIEWALISTECYGLMPLMLEIGFYMDKVRTKKDIDHEVEYEKIKRAYQDTINKIERVNDLIKNLPKGEINLYVK